MKKLKITLALIVLINVIKISSCSEYGHCGGSCTQSKDCANDAGDQNCRCSYLTCTIIESQCGGGCMTDQQCKTWSGGDDSCVCAWWFECDDRKNLKNPGYKPFLKIAALAKQKKLKQHQFQTN